MLTSTKNPLIQHIRKLQNSSRTRKESGQFVVEGVRLLEEVLVSGRVPENVLYTENPGERAAAILEGFRAMGIAPIDVSESVMRAAGDTRTPQGLLAVLPIFSQPLPPDPTFIVVLDGVRDPGNLGTILRTAAAAGADGVVLAPGSADPFQPKVMRAGMGAHFRVPLFEFEWKDIDALTPGKRVYVAASDGSMDYTAAILAEPLVLLIGGEADGVGSMAAGLNPTGLRIPMPGGTESLNAAVAAGILMFEVVRQRGREDDAG